MRKLLGLVFVSLTLMTCGGGGSGSQGLCQQIGSATCAKACSCREGPTCAISQGGIALEFPSDSDCKGWFITLGCSMGDSKAYNDAAACLPLVQAATCTGTGTEAAVSYPPDKACESPDAP
jgi:hypothetical protein